MAEFDKWLISVSADDCVTKVARRAIKQRTRAVAHFLKRAKGGGDNNVESVHQLRVWSRRATAALGMFGELLPRRKSRKLRRILRRLRRLGGEARDCDLLLQSLAAEPTTPQTLSLMRRLRKRRKTAQLDIDRAKRKLSDHGKLKRQRKKVLSAIQLRRGKRKRLTFRDWASERLQALLERFIAFEASEFEEDERLHELRVAGKRLRYAAELSVAAFPRIESSGVYDQIVQLQDRLGDAVDHLAAIKRLQDVADDAPAEDRPYLEGSITEHRRQFSSKKRKLVRYWTSARRRSIESRWRGALRGER